MELIFQWGHTVIPDDYTTTFKYPIAVSTVLNAIGIGVLAKSDMNAKTVSGVFELVTKNTFTFRTQLAQSPSVRALLIAI